MPFHQRTRAMAADPLDVVLTAVRTMPKSGRYGQSNVFISSVWDRVKRSLGMSESQFKDWLIEQNRKQNLALARADLIDDMDPVKVERSEISNLGAQFHFIIDRDARRREWPEMAMHPTSQPRGAQVPKIPTKKMEQDIERVRSNAELYYPGGSGGGGRKRSRGEAGAVVLPHARTSPSCKLCTKYHTTAEHRRHDRGGKPAKASVSAKTKAKRAPAKKATPKTTPKKTKAKAARPVTRRVELPVVDVEKFRAPVMPAPVMPSAPSSSDVRTLVMDAVRNMPSSGRFGRKVFISEIWDRVGGETGMSFEKFRKWLLEANRDGVLVLARADLVSAMNPEMVRKSEISDRGATFHFVLDPDL